MSKDSRGDKMKSTASGDKARLYFIQALSPLHAGVGDGLGAANLPTARERLTGYPFLPGSTIKGVLRDEARNRSREKEELLDEDLLGAFGPPTTHASDARGGLVLSDASLLALPVQSLYGTFAWVTCPFVARRLARDTRETGGTAAESLRKLAAAELTTEASAWLSKGSALWAGGTDKKLWLLDLSAGAEERGEADALAIWIAKQLWPGDEDARAFFRRRLCIVSDDVFGFLTRTAVEVRNRVKLDDETGTAAASGPWTEEMLPAETLFHGVALGRETRVFRGGRAEDAKANGGVARAAEQAVGTLAAILKDDPTLRFGGKSSIGLGRARMALGAAEKAS
jgi:CRISPR-associated protein Cmr4